MMRVDEGVILDDEKSTASVANADKISHDHPNHQQSPIIQRLRRHGGVHTEHFTDPHVCMKRHCRRYFNEITARNGKVTPFTSW